MYNLSKTIFIPLIVSNLIVFIVIFAQQRYSLGKIADNKEEASLRNLITLFNSNIREKILIGDHISVNRICNDIFEIDGISSIKVEGVNQTDICNLAHPEPAKAAIEDRIYFSPDNAVVAATVTVGYSLVLAESISEWIYITAFASILAILLFQMIIIRYFTKRVTTPLDLITQRISRENLEFLKDFKLSSVKSFEIHNLVSGLSKLKFKLEKYQESLISAEKNEAIAKTTTMFAHDVRKPFSMLHELIDHIAAIKNVDELRQVLIETLPEVSRSMVNVEGMIEDLMEVGSESNLILENVEPSQVLVKALENVFGYSQFKKINLVSTLCHTHSIAVDVRKIDRVVTNVLSNAAEHIGGDRKIWLQTKDSGNFIEIVLGNSGSFIPPEDIDKLFDAFYTKNKKTGTGLGLAIAKKITEAHGGTICCRSMLNYGTEFVLQIPAADQVQKCDKNIIPDSSDHFKKTFSTFGSKDAEVNKPKRLSTELVDNSKVSSPFCLCVAVVACNVGFARLILDSFENLPVEVQEVESSILFEVDNLASSILSRFDLLIIDDRLRSAEPWESIQVSERLRDKGYRGYVVYASESRCEIFDSYSKKISSLFDIPITFDSTFASEVVNVLAKAKSESTIVLIEDEAIFRRRWIKEFGEKIKCYSSYSSFSEALSSSLCQHPIDFIVTDFYLEDSRTGLDVLNLCQAEKATVPVFLYSDITNDKDLNLDGFHTLLPKDPRSAIESLKIFLISRAKIQVKEN